MGIRLFDIQNNKVTPTEHCYTIGSLKRIMEEYPNDYLSIYAYLFYMASLNEDENPFANVPEADKEDIVLKEVGGNFSPDEEAVYTALELVKKLHESTTYNAFLAIKTYLEKLNTYMRTAAITDGRDGNIMAGLKVAEKYNEIRESFNRTFKDFKEEQGRQSRGGQDIAYDQ